MYDVIVIGLGGMGSAAAFHLARRGLEVLGLEQFTPAHDRGSSHGESRIIRQAYYEGAEYVPLLLRAYELWEELEKESGRDLLTLNGAMMVGPRDSGLVSGSLRSAEEYGLPHELLEARELRRRFPAFKPTPGVVALFEERGGSVRPEASINAHLGLAARHGADLRFQEAVFSWEASPDKVRVESPNGSYEAEKLVIAPGAWAPQLLEGLGLPLQVERRVMFWFEPEESPELFSFERFPVFLWEPDDGRVFYGIPDGSGLVKTSFHHVDGASCTPETLDREVHEEEIQLIRDQLEEYVPALAGRCVRAVACMYTNTPDLHFVISSHPDHSQVALAAGFSGHGYKFCSVVGEILADLAIEGETRHSIDLFSPARLEA